MKSSDLDPRVQRTRQALRSALLELAALRPFASLTIQDVAHQAGLNRTTFYLHYTGLAELMEDCARSLFAELRREIFASLPQAAAPDLPARLEPFVRSVFLHLQQHGKFYRAMLGRQGDPYFRSLFQEFLAELLFDPATGLSKTPDELIVRFFSAGFSGAAAWWLENDRLVSIEQASRQVARDILPAYLRLTRGLRA